MIVDLMDTQKGKVMKLFKNKKGEWDPEILLAFMVLFAVIGMIFLGREVLIQVRDLLERPVQMEYLEHL